MTNFFKKAWSLLDTKFGFYVLAVILFVIKTVYAYHTKFNLGAKGQLQEFLLILNPLPSTMLILGIALYFKGRKSYFIMLILDFLETLWLFSNILYYREFSDFLTMNLIKGSGAVSNNLGKGIFGILQPTDFLVFLDVGILIVLLLMKAIRMDPKPFKKLWAFCISVLAIVLFFINLQIANSDRSGLLTRTFDNNYIVKYLGVNFFAGYDAVKTYNTSMKREDTKSSDLDSVKKFVDKNYAAPSPEYYGKAKGKNVIVFHLESFQQFLIDYKLDGKEVTPNMNKIFHSNDSLSFDNFYNQVGQGKTADAELMLENSLFGLPEGAAMVTSGTSNTFNALPGILGQDGYTTASFHGDVPSFWNRDNAYKSFGYDYFFSKDYFTQGKDYDIGYGMKDKIFLKDSAQYLEQLPQPYYAKLITVTNHYPYDLDKKNTSIPKTKTGDDTVDGYVQTARYLDDAVGEFMTWMKKTGMDKNTMVVFYGDHYGISGNHKDAYSKLLNKDDFNDFDVAQAQKVPLIINMPGLKGKVDHTYGGEIDVMPTIMDLLGVSTKNKIMFGQDLLSPQRNQIVPFRNGDFVTPDYTKVGSNLYSTKKGVRLKMTPPLAEVEKKISNYVETDLTLSDRVVTGDLLRFYNPFDFKEIDKSKYNYAKKKSLAKLKKKPKNSLRAYTKRSWFDEYVTDAPELK